MTTNLGIDDLAKDALGFLKEEKLGQPFQRSIGRPVVDHDHFVIGILQREKGADALDDC
jgi:hypothetical protein